MKNVDILYEDSGCVILNKPAGLAVQGGEGVRVSLDSLLREEWKTPPFLVHRLDRDTSGLLLVAKTREAARCYGGLFAGGEAGKTYFAVCSGRPRPGSGIIDLDIAIRGKPKKALTRYRVLAAGGGFSFLELELGTGRMHQLRRHLAGIGCPILGDGKYGDFSLNKKLRSERGLKRLLLHAAKLELPLKEGRLSLSAPLPAYFAPFVAEFGLAEFCPISE